MFSFKNALESIDVDIENMKSVTLTRYTVDSYTHLKSTIFLKSKYLRVSVESYVTPSRKSEQAISEKCTKIKRVHRQHRLRNFYCYIG